MPQTMTLEQARQFFRGTWLEGSESLYIHQLPPLGYSPETDLALEMVRRGVSPQNIRELDLWTGRAHYEYALPYGTVNRNVWVLNQRTGGWSYITETGETLSVQEALRRYPWLAPPSTEGGQTRPQSGGQTGGSTSTSDGRSAVEFQFQNISSGDNTKFYPGERWKITIRGNPGGRVTIEGTKDGTPFSVDFDVLDRTGNLDRIGTVAEGDIGNWVQYYKLDGRVIATIRFSVVRRPGGRDRDVTGNGASGGSTNGGGGADDGGGGGGQSTDWSQYSKYLIPIIAVLLLGRDAPGTAA